MGSDFKFSEYQKETANNAVYPDETPLQYLALGITGESGEVADKIKKKEPDGELDEEELSKELGDVLWYLTQLASKLDKDLGEIAKENIEKLQERRK